MRAFLHRNRWYLLAACFLFFGARWAFLHNKPERLREMDLTSGPPLCIRDNICYFSEPDGALRHPKHLTDPEYVVGMYGSRSFSIRAMPVFGGPAKTVVEDPRQNTIFHRLHIGEDAITYLAYPESQAQSLSWQSSVPGASYKLKYRLCYTRASLHSASFAGGAPVDILPGKQFTIATNFRGAMCVTREKVYWIEVDPTHKPYTACASLKVVSRSGGEPKTLMAGISPQASLSLEAKNEATVWVFVPTGEKTEIGSLINIYRLEVADNHLQLFIEKTHSGWYTFQPVTLKDRVYWKRSTPNSTQFQYYQNEILSARQDGSDQRATDLLQTTQSALALFYLYPHGGALYTEVHLQEGPQPTKSNYVLMRIDPDRTDRYQEVFRFPLGASSPIYEGDYVYYTLDEERKSLWDWSWKSTEFTLTRTLYRYRLPD